MTIEELKKLLEEGKITKEQFDVMALAIDPNYKPEEDKKDDKKDEPDIEKMVQQAVDRATNKLGNDNKKLREELDKLRKEKLTDEERAALDKAEFERQKAEFQMEKNKLYAVKAIKAAGLDDGSDKSLELVEFVMGDSEETIDARVKVFGELVKKFVAAEVDKTFKDNGRNPYKGKGGGEIEKNPYTKEHYNLTEQMKLEATDPEKAKRLQVAALAVK